MNQEQNTNDGDISSIGVQSDGSPGRKNERTVIAAAAMASGSIMGSKNPVDTAKDEGSVTVHREMDRIRQNTAKSDIGLFILPNPTESVTNLSCLPHLHPVMMRYWIITLHRLQPTMETLSYLIPWKIFWAHGPCLPIWNL